VNRATLPLVPPEAVPKFGTFFSLYRTNLPPLPFLRPQCAERGLPVYWLGGTRFLVDDTSLDWAAMEAERRLLQAAAAAGMSDNSAALLEGGGESSLMSCAYGPNDLWLEVVTVTNQTAVLTVHSPVTNGVYDLYFVPDLNYQRWQWRRVLCGVVGQTEYVLPMPDPGQGYFIALDAADDDNDGLGNGYEAWFNYGPSGLTTTNVPPNGSDSDGDSLPDGWEVQYGLNPTSANDPDGSTGNPDGDTLQNWLELAGYVRGGPQDPLAPTNRPVVSVRALPAAAGCPQGAFTITRAAGPDTNAYRQPLRVYYCVGGTLRYGVDYTLDPAPQTTSSDADHPDGYPRIFFADIPADQTFVTVTANRIGPLTDGGPATNIVALTPFAVAPKVQVQEPANWEYVVALMPLATHTGRAEVELGSAMPAPTLTVECRRDRLVLFWAVPDWVTSSGLITNFLIYRCECTGTTTNCVPTGTPYHTTDASSRIWVDEGLNTTNRYCYAISFGFTDRCTGYDTPSESPGSAVACGSPCDPPPTGPLDVAFIIDNTSSMTNSLTAIKQSIASVLADIAMASSNDFRLAIVTPDTNDDVNPTNSATDGTGHDMVVVRLPFTNNAAVFTNLLNSIQTGFGFNWPESTDECLNTVVNALTQSGRVDTNQCAPAEKLLQLGDFTPGFRTNAAKRVVLISDAVPSGFCDDADRVHQATNNAHHWAELAYAAGIKINAIEIGTFGPGSPYGDTQTVMQDYAGTSCGWYTDVPNDSDADAIYDALVLMLYTPIICP